MDVQAMLEREEQEREAYEARTVAARINGQDVTIATLRQVSDAVFEPSNWKAPFAVYVHHDLVPFVIGAAKFFHADVPEIGGIQPLTGRVLVTGHGYQA